eukprot:7060585-Pyramimonas_sp.AAC.1
MCTTPTWLLRRLGGRATGMKVEASLLPTSQAVAYRLASCLLPTIYLVGWSHPRGASWAVQPALEVCVLREGRVACACQVGLRGPLVDL